jgi:archaellum component FlaC
MITDADIKKMKVVFATKDDFTAIQRMFDSSKKETNERFDSMDKRFDSMDKKFVSIDKRFENIDKRLESMDKKFESKIDSLSDRLQKNTEDLIELITTGFNTFNYDSRLQEQDSILNDHEKRIEQIEEKAFKAN